MTTADPHQSGEDDVRFIDTIQAANPEYVYGS